MKGRILLCVLDWGLGHATRSLAVVEELEFNQFEVILASSGDALALLRLELPHHTVYELPAYNVLYNTRSFQWGIILQSRKILSAINREHSLVGEIVRRERIDCIISDNRYGCYHDGVRSIFLSHHLNILLSGTWQVLGPALNELHIRLIRKFQEVWVPDYPDRTLSGDLSRIESSDVRFIGPLSTMRVEQDSQGVKRDVIAVLSGPEPARTRFSELLFQQLSSYGRDFLIVEGRPGLRNGSSPSRVDFLKRKELGRAIRESSIVISRPGYSTIMDMSALGGKCIFIPTPGQTEQIYLAAHMQTTGIAPYHAQDKLDLAHAIADSSHYKGFDGLKEKEDRFLRKAILDLAR